MTGDGFGDLIATAQRFYAALAADNSRDWFGANRGVHDEVIKPGAALLGDILAEDLSRLTGDALAAKVFRIHRDVRFSGDKSPYNPHLHIMWAEKTGRPSPVFFFAVEPDDVWAATGIAGLRTDSLTAYRALIDREGDAVAAALEAAGMPLSDFGAAPLKNVPKPYSPDHPHCDLLRRKSLVVGCEPEGWRDGLPEALRAHYARTLPLYRLLARI